MLTLKITSSSAIGLLLRCADLGRSYMKVFVSHTSSIFLAFAQRRLCEDFVFKVCYEPTCIVRVAGQS